MANSKLNVSLEKLLETSAHFGHQARRWNPKISGYLYGEEEGVHLFDLVKTKEALEEALEVLKGFAKEGKSIIFVGTKKQAKKKIIEVAKATGLFYVSERWLGGTLTNFEQIRKSLEKLEKMKKDKEEGVYRRFTKKERLLLDREIERLERFFGGLVGLKGQPDLLVVVDTKKESGAVIEALSRGIETIAIVDSNSDPTKVTYPIPMNDDSTKAIEYVLDLMKEAILKGKEGVKNENKDENNS